MIKNGIWKNWSRTAECIPEHIIYPVSIKEICSIVKEAKQHKKTIRVAGAGHSFTDLVKTDDILISLNRLSGIINIDEETGIAEVYAGTRLHEIGRELLLRGYAFENLGDINVQSIAGAISTGTHGTGLSFGNISSQVRELTIVDGNGDILVVSETADADLYKASLVSLGLLGVIVKVKLKIVKAPIYELRSVKVQIDKLMEQLDHYINNNLHFEFFMFPYSDFVQVKTMNPTTKPPQSLTFYQYKNMILENYLFYAISEICRFFPRSCKYFSRLSARGVATSTVVSASQNLFASPRIVKFAEMEYCIPLEYAKEAISEARQIIERKQHIVHFPIECRTVKEDDIWLSPSFKRTSFYMAFHMYKGMAYEPYFRDIEALMDKYKGRPHWGKLHNKNQKELIDLYPKLPDFLKLRLKHDPDAIFMNDYTKLLFDECDAVKINL